MGFDFSVLVTYLSNLFSKNDSKKNINIVNNKQNFQCNSNCCNPYNSGVCTHCDKQFHKKHLSYICRNCSTSSIPKIFSVNTSSSVDTSPYISYISDDSNGTS